jgi:hypothetical protein
VYIAAKFYQNFNSILADFQLSEGQSNFNTWTGEPNRPCRTEVLTETGEGVNQAPSRGRILKTIISSIICMLGFALSLPAQLTTYDWPLQAGLSDRYRVFVRIGQAPEQEIRVLMSRASPAGDYRARELEGRTFSFATMSFSPGAGPLTVRAVKIFGSGADQASIHPRSFAIPCDLASGGTQVVFQVTKPSRYISVHFKSPDNRTDPHGWIKHMLCIFVDPPETNVPATNGPGVAAYSPSVPPEQLKAAKVICFPAGYHNLRDYRHGGIIDSDGQLLMQNGQELYLAGGAFVEGIIGCAEGKCVGQRVYGRGILSGRQYLWRCNPDHRPPEYGQLLKLGNKGRVEGITLLDSPQHGIVGWTTRITNTKLVGWHCNNDGIRVGQGAEISDSFVRAVDDHFYNFNIHVHDVVLWAGHNGAILTYGWGGKGSYHSGASLLENIDVINPEWIALGNNNGLVASQVNFDYRPFEYGGKSTTVLRNIRIEGSIPGLVNLKPYTGDKGQIEAKPVAGDKIGYLGDLVVENVSVEAQTGKSRVRGAASASTKGDGIFYIQNVQFKNLRIGETLVTEDNKLKYFDIDTATTRNITFQEK